MKKNPLLTISLVSVLVAILVVVVLKLLGYDNPTVIGGGVAGGVIGAISSTVLKKK
jgi:hypothetical protein